MNTAINETRLSIKERAANDIRQAFHGKVESTQLDAMIHNISSSSNRTGEFRVIGALLYMHIWVWSPSGEQSDCKFEGNAGGMGLISAGGGQGDIYTDDFDQLVRDTTSFMFTADLVYFAIYFYDKDHNLLGHLQAGGIGTQGIFGGGGSWTILTTDPFWDKYSGKLAHISVGSKANVWGVNSDGSIYCYTQKYRNPWILVPGGLEDIGVGSDGTVWGVTASGVIFRYSEHGAWTQIPGNLKRISVGSKTKVWGINSAGQVYRYSQDDKYPWFLVPDTCLGSQGLLDIGVASDGTVWGVDPAGDVYQYRTASIA